MDAVGSVGGSFPVNIADLVPPASQPQPSGTGVPAAGPSIAEVHASMVAPNLAAQSSDILGPVEVRKLQPIVNGVAEISQMPVRAVALRSADDFMYRALAFTHVILSPMSGGGDPGPGGGGPQ